VSSINPNILIIFLLLCFVQQQVLNAQDHYFLALDKPGLVNRKRFYVDEKVSIKIRQDKTWIKGEIDLIDSESLIINNNKILIKDISHLRINRLHGANRRFKILAIGGLMFVSAFSINSLVNNDSPFLSRGEWMAPLGLTLPFVFLQPFRKRTYYIKEKRVLKSIQIF